MGIKIKRGRKRGKKGEELKRGKYKVEIEGEEYEAYIDKKKGEKLIAIINFNQYYNKQVLNKIRVFL